MKISPSLMCMDLIRFKEQIEFIDQHADYLHVDIMDGHFVPNLTLSPYFVSQVRRLASKPMDCHLMVTNPEYYIDTLAEAGAGMITLHPETLSGQAFRIVDKIRKLGLKVGFILNPESSLEMMKYYIHLADKVTVLTVDPGFAGQPFIGEMLAKIRQLKAYRQQHGLRYEIEIDGSCNERTFTSLIEAGADVLIVGSSGLFNHHDDIRQAWRIMQGNIAKAQQEVDGHA
ncbi:D-allulose 6-phosphate 3-epimerase [Martelella alba]|uniref:Putative D-allulose-6-phosphate 3-epimerase n=1 Tax=Martelella alba TaxID=2590451 RepID=A0ABY2SJ21_9HYPH|nr:D-allulose 6-phosphate 3-epimerase [Martelella alba]TKI05457.1 ribulose-phosphate 3-epimerase [Martelella alba]